MPQSPGLEFAGHTSEGGSDMLKSQSAQRRPDGRRERGSPRLQFEFAAAFCAAAFAIGFSGCNGDTKRSQPATQLVSLEAANSPGSSPWMESTTSPDLPRRLNRVENTSTPSTQTVSGDQIGLYGGSTNQAVCDRDQMVNFLERNPAQSAAWRTVAHVSDIRAYASTLSPVVLLRDTRVTNHGFENGAPTTFQSVLQTGTAVLVDNRGIPRVRCDSGSPLDEPQSDASEEFTGTGWQGLDSDSVVKVQRSDTPIAALIVTAMPVVEPSPGPPSTTSATTTETTAPSSTTYLEPPTQLAQIAPGQTLAMPEPRNLLPPGARVVPIEVTPPHTSVTSSTQTSSGLTTTSSVTTTTMPSTTTTSTTPSVSSSSSSAQTSATRSVPATTAGAETSSVPTEETPQDTSVPNP
jgi:hypothetical protein